MKNHKNLQKIYKKRKNFSTLKMWNILKKLKGNKKWKQQLLWRKI